MAEEYKKEQKVRRRQDGRYGAVGVIKHIEDNVALVRYNLNDNRLIKLSELISAEPPKPQPIEPGWYRVRFKPASNFLYYIAIDTGRDLLYTHAFNPVTGEMDTFGFGSLALSKQILNVNRGDLIRQRFTDVT